jgi:hypothetical protein
VETINRALPVKGPEEQQSLQTRNELSEVSRIVEYSQGYLADHWCHKGHIVHCLECEFVSELQNGEEFVLTEGMTYVVSDGLSSHRSFTKNGVKVLIIDGDFLKTAG